MKVTVLSRMLLGLSVAAMSSLLLACAGNDSSESSGAQLEAPTAVITFAGQDTPTPASVPGQPAATPVVSNLAIEAYSQGLAAQGQGKMDDAEAGYRRAIAASPDFAAALYNLAAIRAAVPSGVQEAITLYRRVVQLTPNDANAYYNLGLALVAAGRKGEGDAEIARAQEIIARRATPTPAGR